MATKTKTASKDANKKMTFKEYTKKLNAAYDSGYKDGWAAHEKLPNVRGSRTAAKCGYNTGLRNHKKADKYSKKAK